MNRKRLYHCGSLQPKRDPVMTIDRQFTMIKTKPTRMDGVINPGKIKDLLNLYGKKFRNPNPVPTNRLKV